ncbi:MAG: CPBP family intramembrane metalloprotease [Planctomycetia bacterium]|nr:CPBP family intramembrane metalloprotease [Planctomycetia bacterium]
MPNQVALGYVVLGIVAASLSAWAIVARRVASGREVVRYESRHAVPWNGWHVVLVAAAFLAMVFAVGLGFRLSMGPPDAVDQSAEATAVEAEPPAQPSAADPLTMLAAVSTANVLTFAFTVLLLTFGARAGPSDLGIVPGRAAQDVVLGLAGFAAVSAPVLIIQRLLEEFVHYEHPVKDIFAGEAGPWALWLTAAFAVIIAPLTEEFFFRVVLQGWLEARLGPHGRDDRTTIVAEPSPAEGDDASLPSPAWPSARPGPAEPAVPTLDVPSGGWETEWALRDAEISRIARQEETTARRRWLAAAIPIGVSSSAFALMHLGSGASPIPLFFYALGLGYLYRQTHRLLPPLVMHASLNLFSVAMLWAGAGP